jgi:hypothetical protein
MTLKKFVKGIILKGEDLDPSENIEGSLFHNKTAPDPRIKTYIQGAVREIITNNQQQTLTNKTIDADSNPISNLEVDNLKTGVLDTDLSSVSTSHDTIPSAKAVKDFVDSSVGTVSNNLTNHLNDAVDAHMASAIGNTPSGNLAATTVQAALDELQTDIDTRATTVALNNHINNTTGAHAASAISNTPSGNLAADNVQSALNELQTDIDGRVAGPASATDNALARFDLTTGKLVQNSSAILEDNGTLSGITDLKIYDSVAASDRLSLNKDGLLDLDTGKGLEISTESGITDITLSASDLTLNASGILLSGTTVVPSFTNSTTTGANASLTVGAFSNILLTNSSLLSIREISQKPEGGLLILTNNTGNDVEIIDNHSSSLGILTGTEADITFRNKSSLLLVYSESTSKWMIIGGTGGGGSLSSVVLTAGENLAINDLVYQDKTSGLVYKAIANDDTKTDVLGFVRKAALASNSVEIITSGVIDGFSGLVAGNLYYLRSDLVGAISQTPPSSNGEWVVAVGIAVSETELVINPVASSSAIYITDSEFVEGLGNDQSSAASISNLLFDPSQVRAFVVEYSIYREDSLEAKAQVGQLRGVYNTRNDAWFLSDDFAGENAGIEFSIQPSGQVQYTSSNFLGTGHACTMKYTIRRTFTI